MECVATPWSYGSPQKVKAGFVFSCIVGLVELPVECLALPKGSVCAVQVVYTFRSTVIAHVALFASTPPVVTASVSGGSEMRRLFFANGLHIRETSQWVPDVLEELPLPYRDEGCLAQTACGSELKIDARKAAVLFEKNKERESSALHWLRCKLATSRDSPTL